MEKREIFKTIAKLFKEKGYHNTSIKDISKKVGLEGGALYYYIKSKEQSLLEIGDNAIDDLFERIKKIDTSDSSPKEKLQAMIRTHINFFIERFYETCVFLIETKALGPKYQSYYISKRDKYESIWRKVIERGMEIEEFKSGDAKLVTFAILGMLNWLVIWFKPNKGWTAEKIAGDFSKLIFAGLLNQ